MADLRIKIKKVYTDLNSLDVNELIKKLNNIKLEDLKNLKLNDLKSIYKNTSFPYLIGSLGFIILSYFLIYPGLSNFFKLQRKANLYENNSYQIPQLIEDRDRLLKIIDKIEAPFSILRKSVIEKNQLILINRILSEVALKSNVRILSLIQIKENPFSICQALNEEEQANLGITYMYLDNDNNNNLDPLMQEGLGYSEGLPDEQLTNFDPNNSFPPDNTPLDKLPPEEINFKNNYLEISLQAKYFNTIKFIRLLQRYKITTMPLCINIGASSYQQSQSEEPDLGNMNSKFIINIPTKEQ